MFGCVTIVENYSVASTDLDRKATFDRCALPPLSPSKGLDLMDLQNEETPRGIYEGAPPIYCACSSPVLP